MAKTVTTEEYIAGIESRLRQVETLNKDLGKVILAIHTDHQEALFVKGLDGEKYSTKPTLAGGNVFGNRNRFGGDSYTFATKSGSNKFFGSKKRRNNADWRRVNTSAGGRSLMLIEGGYRAIRQADGRRVDKVDLTHTGQLRNDFRSSLTKTSAGWVSGVRKKDNVGKLEGAVKRYGRKMGVPESVLAKYRPRLGAIMAKFLTL